MFKLVIQDDEGKTTVVPLIRDEITIGRKEGNTIRLTERNVSRRHARILRNNGEVQIEDLGSYNGIRVNNARIAERVSLRVSDQVQIGDYKLYLKAEGVEQIDDSRTVPIERIDGAATDQMPAVSSSPTVPIPAQTLAAAAAAAGPARPIGEVDQAGRPVATAAQVAALSQQATYGKLVVVSSNYAGKEFDLTRPQMIVGRTDENDLVINHRSISRNHAKITRDPETGRYTISDLQSSNGVRVNGQDYGKVELRRADVVDLGHVRLRFVEPGEDFLFSRDAVVTDVPEGGARRGLLIAVALGVLLLAGVAVFIVVSSGKGSSADNGHKTDNSGSNLATNVASGSSDVGSNDVGSGSGAVAMTAQTPDAGTAAVPPNPNAGGDEAAQVRVQCLEFKTQKNWSELSNCSNKLAALDPNLARDLKAKAKAELGNELHLADLDEAVRKQDLNAAKKQLDLIDDDSVYHKAAQDKYQGLEGNQIDQFKASALALRAKHNCTEYERLLARAEKLSPKIGEVVRQVHCEPLAATTNPEHKPPPGNGSGTTTQVTPPPQPTTCDADQLETKGSSDTGQGHYAEALVSYESLYNCKPSPRAAQLAFMAACNVVNLPKARKYYKKLSADAQSRFVTMCIRRNITKDQLDAP